MAVPGEVTDPDSVVGERGQVGAVDVYVARPADADAHPGLVVVHEAFGRVPHIEDVCRRFASLGYVAAAPELYSRTGPPGEDMGLVLERMFGLPDAQAVGDLAAVADWLRDRPDTTGRVGVIGFCMGGRLTALAAVTTTAFDAAVSCWGGFLTRATFDEATTDARPTPVVDLAAGLSCPLLLCGGADDENPSPDELSSLHHRLVGAGRDVELRLYEGAGHAFFADYRPQYVEHQAFALWDDVTAFLADRLPDRLGT